MTNESIDADDPMPCMECGKPTRRLVIVWHGPLCSEACDAKFEEGFWEAVRHPRSDEEIEAEADAFDVGF